MFVIWVTGTSRPEASRRRAETEGGGRDAGEGDGGETKGRAGEGEGEDEQHGPAAEDAHSGGGGLQRGTSAAFSWLGAGVQFSQNFLLHSPEACGREARGGFAGAAGGQAAGG